MTPSILVYDEDENDTDLSSQANDVAPISLIQQKAARYTLMSGKANYGLSIDRTQEYLDCLDDKGEVLALWPSARKFWIDHSMRQRIVLARTGEWRKLRIPKVEHAASYTVPEYTEWIKIFLKQWFMSLRAQNCSIGI